MSPDRQLSFSPCTLLTDPSKPWPGFDGAASAMAECATTTAPALWSDPNGDSINLFVKRHRAAHQPAKGQLWLLSGGPGDAGTYFEFLSHRIASSIPSLDIYMPHHRGTGKSSFADCVVTPQTVPACVAKLPHLDGVTTTDAA